MDTIKTYDSLDGGSARPAAAVDGDSTLTVQPRKAETATGSYREGGITPAAEVKSPLETQPRKAVNTTSANGQAPKGHEEQMFPEDFNRHGSNFVDTSHVRSVGGE